MEAGHDLEEEVCQYLQAWWVSQVLRVQRKGEKKRSILRKREKLEGGS